MNISKYIDSSRIIFPENTNRDHTLSSLVELSEDCLHNKDKFLEAILEREKIMTTGLGFEVAFPHAKNESVIDFFISIAVSKNGIEWNSLDGQTAKIIFLIGGPVNGQMTYLKILAKLSSLTKDQSNKDKLLQAQSPTELEQALNELISN